MINFYPLKQIYAYNNGEKCLFIKMFEFPNYYMSMFSASYMFRLIDHILHNVFKLVTKLVRSLHKKAYRLDYK